MTLLDRLLRDVPFSASELMTLIRTAPHRYKVYSVPKRSSNGYRIIAQPSGEVKVLQRWVSTHVLSKYPVHPAAVAYRPHVGIGDNAAKHVRQRFLLKLDFKDFFPSIKAVDFEHHTRKYAQEFVEDISLLTNILFRKPKKSTDLVLSIGAPSSPALSNSVVYDFDIAISSYTIAHKMVYTRYADDLIFSTNDRDALKDLYEYVKQICKTIAYPTLSLNFAKTVFTSKKWNRTVTGLVLTNDQRVSIGWEKKRVLRTQVYRYLQGKLADEDIAKLRGYLSFVRDVEPTLFEKLKGKVPKDARLALFGE